MASTNNELNNFISETFEKLHSIPEVGFTEKKTSTYLADSLEKMGYIVERNIGTNGIMGVLDSGNPGENFALRGDMDALEFIENGEKICVHACGHDANSTMVLAAAKVAAQRGIKSGKLHIVLDQAEEKNGTIEMIETGKMDNIDRMVGVHLRPAEEANLGQIISGVSHGAVYLVRMKITGKQSHGARAHLGVNAIETAVAIMTLVGMIKENSNIPHSVKPTEIRTEGNAANSVPDVCHLTFDVRSQGDEVASNILRKVKLICESVAQANGAMIEDYSEYGVAAANLDPEVTAICSEAVSEVLGSENDLGVKTVTGADCVHYYTKLRGIKLGFIGVGADMKYGLHNRNMSFNHEALNIGTDLLIKVLEKTVGLK